MFLAIVLLAKILLTSAQLSGVNFVEVSSVMQTTITIAFEDVNGGQDRSYLIYTVPPTIQPVSPVVVQSTVGNILQTFEVVNLNPDTSYTICVAVLNVGGLPECTAGTTDAVPPEETLILPLQVLNCSETPIISLNQDKLEELGLDLGDQVIVWPRREYLADELPERCVKTYDNETVVFHIGVADCEPDIQEDDYIINVTYTVRNLPYKDLSEPVQRYDDNCLLLTCSFEKKENLTKGAIIPDIKKTEIAEVVEDAEFEIEMNFYENCSFDEELESLEVFVPDYVNVKVELVDLDDEQFILQVVRNYEPLYGGFKFQSFVWTNVIDDEQQIFAHCEVVVCHNSTDDQCQDPGDCGSKRRRDVIGFRMEEGGRIFVTSQRLRLLQSESITCEKDNGGCSDKCLMSGDEVMCDCFGRREMEEDGKTCFYFENPHFNFHETSPEEATGNQSVMMFAALALLIILAGCAVCIHTSNKAYVMKIYLIY